jgi:cell division protein FtsL
MNTLPPRITMHLRPAVRRLTLSWIAAVVIVAAMTVGMAYNARQVVGACWLAVAVLFIYAMSVLRRLRP